MAEMIRYLTREKNFDSDMADAVGFLRRRLVRTIDTEETAKHLADTLKTEWLPGITITSWVSRAVEHINGMPADESQRSVVRERMAIPMMNATEYRIALDRLHLSEVAASTLLGVGVGRMQRWARGGDVPVAETRLLRLMAKLHLTIEQVTELSQEPIETSPPSVAL